MRSRGGLGALELLELRWMQSLCPLRSGGLTLGG